MSAETEKSEAAGVTAPAASESKNPTVEVKLIESAANVAESSGEGKPADGEAAQPENHPQIESADPVGVAVHATADSGGVTLEEVMHAPVRTLAENVIYLPVDDLKPHPLNEKIYGHDLDQAFVAAIEKNGIYQPILITSQKIIIAGHRRHAAAKQLGKEKVPTVEFYSNDELEIRAALVEANKQRVKTNEQMGREFKVLLEVEAERARLRMATNKEGQGVQPVAQAEKGKSRDKVAEKVGGMSGVSLEHAAAVVDVIDKLAGSGSERTKKKADVLRELLKTNIKGAHKKAVDDGYIKVEGKKGGKPTQARGTSKKNGAVSPTPTPPPAAPAPSSPIVVVEGYDKGLQGLYDAETFLVSRDSTKLSQPQKDAWKKVVQHIVKMLATIGVSISLK